MRRPSPLILTFLLLLAAFIITSQPLLQALCTLGMIVVGLIAIVRLFTVDARIRRLATALWASGAIWIAGGLLALAAGGGVLFVRPHLLRVTYLPGNLSHAPALVDQRGFYRVETDGAGNRYTWTQERATLVLDFLVHRPITVTVEMRGAAIAGGPDMPVRLQANGVDAGELRPDPARADFQSFPLRFVPYNWGGGQTEIKLLAAPFRPGNGDTRTLGVMVKSITVDKAEAWAGIESRIWLERCIPLPALGFLGLMFAARLRPDRAALGYAAVAVCAVGAACAALAFVQIVRIGVIEPTVYRAWVIGYGYLGLFFAVAALMLPLGAAHAPSIVRRAYGGVRHHAAVQRARRIMGGLLPPPTAAASPGGGEIARRAIARDLALVFAIALAVRLIWALLVPPWQAPDEPDHYVYVAHVAEQAEIPHPPYPPYPWYPQEFTQSAGLTFFAKLSPQAGGTQAPELPYLPISYDYASARSYTGSHDERLAAAGGRATPYPPLYYLLTAIPYKLFQHAPILARLFAVRCGTAILGALTCVFGYLLAYEIRRERRWGWGLALSLALLPMFAFITATANNDAAMDLGATALIWLLVRLFRQGAITAPSALVVGLVSGLTLLTKPGPLPVVAAVGVFMLVKSLPSLARPFQYSKQRLAALGGYVAGGLLGYGPWVLFRHAYYGDLSAGLGSLTSTFRALTGVTRVAAAPAGGAPLASLAYPISAYLRHELHLPQEYFRFLFIKSVWGNFGWLEVPMPDSIFAVITAICAIGMAGIALQLALQPRRRPILLILLAIIASQAAFLFLVVDYYTSYAQTGVNFGLQGRYFYPVLAPACFLLLSGWDHLLGGHPVALRLAPFVMAGVQLIGLATILARYYGVVIGWT